MKALHIAMIGMAIAAFLGAFGQIMLKSANVQFNVSAITNWRLWLFFACYGVGVIINIVAYRYGSVGALYPVISLSYIFSMLLAAWLINEPLSLLKFGGAITIVAGVTMIAYG